MRLIEFWQQFVNALLLPNSFLCLRLVEVSVARYLRTPPAAAKQQDLSFQCFELLTQLEPLELCCHLQLALMNR
jgi:hypothetical protein